MKKKIISKTLTFICILLFISLFKHIFGDANSPVGITTVIAVLILMSENLTVSPIKNFMKLLLINIIIGMGAFIASQDIYWGVIIDFSVLWFIGYYFSVNLTKTIILPFGLQYLFILYDPVYGENLIKRFRALAFAPFLIMLIQYLIYGRNKKIEVEKSDILEFSKSDDTYEKVKILGIEFKVNKIRAYYALRLSLLIAITAFINGRFLLPNGIQEGKWMVYSIFSLTELFGENCRIKSKKRIQGTIIGALIVLILFMFIKSTPLRGLIILIAGYLNSYFEDYRDTMVCVTVSTVASVALTNGTLLTAIERILFVSIGILISLIGNKLIFSDFKKGEIE